MNIAIIGQNFIFRDSLKILLNQVAGFNVIFDSDEAIKLTGFQDFLSIDVVLFDDCMRSESFCNSIHKTKQLHAKAKILLLTDPTDYYYWINQKEFPVDGILLKDLGKKEFEMEIRGLMKTSE
ncbi:MAG: hypothetical protein WCO63_07165 [Bacteroidota bacterium]